MLQVGLAFLVTVAVAAGVYGLGDLIIQRSGSGIRWVLGWTALWWVIALPAQLIGPPAGITFGAATVAVGAVRIAQRWKENRPAIVAGSIGLLAGSPLWLAPPHFYDSLVYHLGLPWSWLINGSFAPSDHNLFSHFPLAGSTVYLLAVRAGSPEAAAGLHWLTFVALLASTGRLAALLGAGRWSWTAPFLLCGCWHAPWLASVAAADHLVALGVVVAVALWVDDEGDDDRAWAPVGISLGLALSSDYAAAAPVAGSLLAALVLSRRRWQAVAAGTVALAASSFWWIRNLIDVFGGREDYARYWSLVRAGDGGAKGWIGDFVDLGMNPSALGVWFAIAAIVALAAVFLHRAATPRVRLVGLAAVLALAGWAVTSQTARYALPAAALVAAMAAGATSHLSRWVRAVTLGGFGLAVAHGIATLSLFLFDSLAIQHTWAGFEAREAWRHEVTLNDPAAAYRAVADLDRDARILIVGECRPWPCPRPHHASSPYDTQWIQDAVERATTAAEVHQAVAGQGFTHVLINWAEMNRLGGEDYGRLRWKSPSDFERFREFGMRMTKRVWTEGPLEIRAIEGSVP